MLFGEPEDTPRKVPAVVETMSDGDDDDPSEKDGKISDTSEVITVVAMADFIVATTRQREIIQYLYIHRSAV